MPPIVRNPAQNATERFDIIIIGGGIYGVFLALQATEYGLRPLLLDSDDFGGGTSFNSLRIIHGGLRYLQSFDMRRFVESVTERRWFLANFPDLVSRLPCLMPLYGKGVRRKSIMRMAMLANDILSYRRNTGLPKQNLIVPARVISAEAALDLFPGLLHDKLKGGALWHDAAVDDSPRLLMELLRWAVARGARAINYARATNLLVRSDKVDGIAAIDSIDSQEYEFHAPLVVNATGPWSEQLSAQFGDERKGIFAPSLAWNLWMDRPAPARCALALTASRPRAPTYFVRPWKNRMLIGTGHAAWSGNLSDPHPTGQQIASMLTDINSAAPELQLSPDQVRHVFAGLLPARKPGSSELSVRPAIINHAEGSRFQGFYTVSGVKFTTARRVALDTLKRIVGRHSIAPTVKSTRPPAALGWQSAGLDFDNEQVENGYLENLRILISDESVQHLTDLVFRRTDLWENPDVVARLAEEIADLFDWSQERKQTEIRNLMGECGIQGTTGTNTDFAIGSTS